MCVSLSVYVYVSKCVCVSVCVSHNVCVSLCVYASLITFLARPQDMFSLTDCHSHSWLSTAKHSWELPFCMALVSEESIPDNNHLGGGIISPSFPGGSVVKNPPINAGDTDSFNL